MASGFPFWERLAPPIRTENLRSLYMRRMSQLELDKTPFFLIMGANVSNFPKICGILLQCETWRECPPKDSPPRWFHTSAIVVLCHWKLLFVTPDSLKTFYPLVSGIGMFTLPWSYCIFLCLKWNSSLFKLQVYVQLVLANCIHPGAIWNNTYFISLIKTWWNHAATARARQAVEGMFQYPPWLLLSCSFKDFGD